MKAKYICYSKETYSPEEMTERSTSHLAYMDQRRTVRDFSSKPIPDDAPVIKTTLAINFYFHFEQKKSDSKRIAFFIYKYIKAYELLLQFRKLLPYHLF